MQKWLKLPEALVGGVGQWKMQRLTRFGIKGTKASAKDNGNEHVQEIFPAGDVGSMAERSFEGSIDMLASNLVLACLVRS